MERSERDKLRRAGITDLEALDRALAMGASLAEFLEGVKGGVDGPSYALGRELGVSHRELLDAGTTQGLDLASYLDARRESLPHVEAVAALRAGIEEIGAMPGASGSA